MWLRPSLAVAVAAVLLVEACSGLPRRVASPPVGRPGYDPAALKLCVAALDRTVARYALLPDRTFSPGCTALGSVQLRDVGLPTTNLGAMTCPLGRAYADWAQNDVQAAAVEHLGARVIRVESMGTYSCRTINGVPGGRLSEHASANAVDIAAFVLSDGRRVSVLQGWGGAAEGQFLRAIRAKACRRFRTVLSPDYNAAHRDHFHFDMGAGGLCS